MTAIETVGNVDDQHQLRLDEPLPIGPGRVRVIVLVPEFGEIDDKTWARATTTSPAFDFLRESAEDIYTLNDGKPFDDKR